MLFLLDRSNGQLTRQELADIYQRTGILVLRRCLRIVRDQAAAEDLTQEVYVRLWRYRASISEQKVTLSWLYRTAERCCFDYLRKAKREPVGGPVDVAGHVTTCLDDTSRQAGAVLLRYLRALDPKLAQVAILRYVDGLTQEEIAQELNWSRRTVGKKLKLLKDKATRFSANLNGGVC